MRCPLSPGRRTASTTPWASPPSPSPRNPSRNPPPLGPAGLPASTGTMTSPGGRLRRPGRTTRRPADHAALSPEPPEPLPPVPAVLPLFPPVPPPVLPVVVVPPVSPLVPVLPVPPVRLDSSPPPPSVPVPPSAPPSVPAPEVSPPPSPLPLPPPVPSAPPPPATTSCPGAGHDPPVSSQIALRISAVSCLPVPVAISPPTSATTTRTRPRYSSAVCPPSRRSFIIRAKLNSRCSARCSRPLRNHWRLPGRHSSTMTATGITSRATPPAPAPPLNSARAPRTIHA